MGYGVVEETSSITQGGSALKHSTKDRRLRKLISRFRDGFLQQRCEKLFDALPTEEVMRAVSEEVKGWRERLFEPLVTLRLFVEQMPAILISKPMLHFRLSIPKIAKQGSE